MKYGSIGSTDEHRVEFDLLKFAIKNIASTNKIGIENGEVTKKW